MTEHILVGERIPLKNEHNNIGAIMLDRLRSRPNFVGLIDANAKRQSTYAEMQEKSVKCAIWLKEQGVEPGDRVAICSNNHLDIYVPCLGALYIGAVMNPWDIRVNPASVEYFQNMVNAKVIFAIESVGKILCETFETKQIKNVPKIVVFGEVLGCLSFTEIINSIPSWKVKDFQCFEIEDPNQTAIILFSSGTTGFPKGLEIPHRNALHVMRLTELRLTSGMISMGYSTISWISGTTHMLHAIWIYSTRIICPEFTDESMAQILQKYQVNWMLCGGSIINQLAFSKILDRYKFPNLKYIVIAGSAIKSNVMNTLMNKLPTTKILKTYGMTELGTVTFQREDSKVESSGFVMSNHTVKIVDTKTGKSLGPNQVGEICVKSDTVTKGYYRNPKATQDLIDSEGWVHTGDLGYFDENKEIYNVERLKELIKFRGSHVSPAEVEEVLHGHPAVREAAVVAVPHPIDEERPMAFVVTHPSAKVTEEELVNYAAEHLVEHKQLSGGVKLVKEIPHTSSGKVARGTLREMAKSLVQ